MMNRLKEIFSLFKRTFEEWNEDKAPRLAAALAYYTAFSLAPLLIVVIALVGVIFGQESAQQEISAQIAASAGSDVASTIESLIEASQKPAEGAISTIIGVVTLLLGAMGVFGQLKGALNEIWDVKPVAKPGGLFGFVREHILNFGMLLVVGLLLLVSLIISTVLSALDAYMLGLLPGWEIVLQILSFVISFLVTTLLFALIYKFLPDIEIQWRDVIIGAALTSLLFSIGRFALSLYLGNSAVASPYGAAGSFVLILLWVYYSAQIIFFGAEFTQVFARRYGSRKHEQAMLDKTHAARMAEVNAAAVTAGIVAPAGGSTRSVALANRPSGLSEVAPRAPSFSKPFALISVLSLMLPLLMALFRRDGTNTESA